MPMAPGCAVPAPCQPRSAATICQARKAEPQFTSRNALFGPNTGAPAVRLDLTIFSTDRDPIVPYTFTVEARRKRRVRLNDLIDPEAMPLRVDYGVLLKSTVPVVVQFTRIDTSQPALAMLGTLAFPVDE